MRNPAICPKCGNKFDPLALLRPQRTRKAEVSKPEVISGSSIDSASPELEIDEVSEADDIESIENIDDAEVEVAEDSDDDSVFAESEDFNDADDVIGEIDQSSESKEV